MTRAQDHVGSGTSLGNGQNVYGDDRVTADTVRRLALGGVLQIRRAREGWSVEHAAVHAGMGHMTWRRLEDGYASRTHSYAKIDHLLGLAPGTVKRSLGDDLLMLALMRDVAGVDTHEATASTATQYVERFANQTLSESAKQTAPARLAPSSAGASSALASDLVAAAALIDRLGRRPPTPAVETARRALLAALPELDRVHDAPVGDAAAPLS